MNKLISASLNLLRGAENNKEEFMRSRLLITLMFIVLSINVHCVIYNIKLDGTGDFTTIQEGINASAETDTVLVHPGRYYENINYNGKHITVASLEMITGDESYIASTIIDGNHQGSCVHFINEENGSILRGFSITNGSGTILYGNIRRLGGGIVIYTPINYPSPDVSIINCRIFNNSAVDGGGMRIQRSNVVLSGVSIYNNQAISGGGISILYESTVIFNPDNLCNLYNNFAGTRIDISVGDAVNDVDVIVDTFTVDSDFDYYGYYTHSFTSTGELIFDIQNNFLDRINNDLYVSTTGDDNNDGLTLSTSLKTIAVALQRIESDSLNPKTIHVANGIYSQALNEQVYPLAGKKCVGLIGEEMENTILLNDYSEMSYLSGQDRISLKNLTFTSVGQSLFHAIEISGADDINLINLLVDNNMVVSLFSVDLYQCYNVEIDNLHVINNISDGASGFSLDGGNAIIKNSVFHNNDLIGSNQFVSNFYCKVDDYLEIENCIFSNSDIPPVPDEENYTVCIFNQQDCYPDIKISNCLFANNYTPNGNYAVYVNSPGTVEMNNCTFTQNTSHVCPLGICGLVELNNNIFYNNTSVYEYEINTGSSFVNSILNISNCDIEGGEAAIYPGNPPNLAIINWLEGNIDADPLFLLSGEHPYQITEFSPCINTGTPDTTGLYLPEYDLAGNPRIYDGIIDMGPYENQNVEIGINVVPDAITYLYNYPNPFNPETKIIFNITESCKVKLEIFNIKGQKVKILIDNNVEKGQYSIIWDGKDCKNQIVSSGIYFYKLTTLTKTLTKRMLLLK